jgi:hypothetical protein
VLPPFQHHGFPVFYREDMLANIDSYSPSAGKRGRVLKAWLDSSLPLGLHEFR